MGRSLTDLQRLFWGSTDEEYTALAAAVDDGVTAQSLFSSLQNDRFFLAANRFLTSSGAPTLNTTTLGGRWPCYAMDAAADEQVNVSFEVPRYWVTLDIDLYWSNLGAAAGNVRWGFTYSNRAAAEDMSAGDVAVADQDVAAPAQNILKITSLVTAVPVVDELWYARVLRNADHANDTLANDAGIVGLMVKRAT